MSVKIHHGAPGSYKTSGAVQDDLVRWARAGRVVVSNIRGLNEEAIKKYVQKNRLLISLLKRDRRVWCFVNARLKGRRFIRNRSYKKGFRLIHVDTDLTADKQHLARWFHWAPLGAGILIDEIQRIYPPNLTRKELEEFSQLNDDTRPPDVHFAFEAHRHYNWDLVLTTPNIKRVSSFIRECSEGAYYHVNKARIGIAGRYNEAFHDPMQQGNSEAQQIDVRLKKISQDTFNLYKSTATGKVKDTEAGVSIFKNPKIIIFGSVLLFGLFWSGNRLKELFGSEDDVQSVGLAASAGSEGDEVRYLEVSENSANNNILVGSAGSDSGDDVVREVKETVLENITKDIPTSFITGLKVYISMSLSNREKVYVIDIGGTDIYIDRRALLKNGVVFQSIAPCLDKELLTGRLITCLPEEDSVAANRDLDVNLFSVGGKNE